ncbi:unnamed protein product [Rhizophagus irregularis]|nr:unnamed protein product [Rhizophagus irregularis]
MHVQILTTKKEKSLALPAILKLIKQRILPILNVRISSKQGVMSSGDKELSKNRGVLGRFSMVLKTK